LALHSLRATPDFDACSLRAHGPDSMARSGDGERTAAGRDADHRPLRQVVPEDFRIDLRAAEPRGDPESEFPEVDRPGGGDLLVLPRSDLQQPDRALFAKGRRSFGADLAFDFVFGAVDGDRDLDLVDVGFPR